jgi:hypothetical protein
MSMIADSNATSTSEALQGIADLPDAVQAVIDYFITNGKPFSSGETAREIRLHTDIRFSVLTVGGILRDWFYADTMPSYDDGDGEPMYPAIVPRTTVGLYPDRTPADQKVFVYACEEEDGQEHEFEVYIPLPGADPSDIDPDPEDEVEDEPEPVLSAAPVGTVPVATLPSLPSNGLVANVIADRRLQIPAKAVEALCHATGQAFRGGMPVHVAIETDKALVALNPFLGSVPHIVNHTRGRVHFASTGVAFVPGTKYPVSVTSAGLVVTL